jgi:hypothetical protein
MMIKNEKHGRFIVASQTLDDPGDNLTHWRRHFLYRFRLSSHTLRLAPSRQETQAFGNNSALTHPLGGGTTER